MSKIVVLLLALAVALDAAPQFPQRPGFGGHHHNRPGGVVPGGFGGFAPAAPLAAPPAANGGTAAGIGQATGNLFANAQGFGTNIPIGPFGSVSIAESTALGVGK